MEMRILNNFSTFSVHWMVVYSKTLLKAGAKESNFGCLILISVSSFELPEVKKLFHILTGLHICLFITSFYLYSMVCM